MNENRTIRTKGPQPKRWTKTGPQEPKVHRQAANENRDVLKEPQPTVSLQKFDGGTLNLELWVWSESKLQDKSNLFSDMNFAIVEKLRANEIEVPTSSVDLAVPKNYDLKPKTEVKEEEIAEEVAV